MASDQEHKVSKRKLSTHLDTQRSVAFVVPFNGGYMEAKGIDLTDSEVYRFFGLTEDEGQYALRSVTDRTHSEDKETLEARGRPPKRSDKALGLCKGGHQLQHSYGALSDCREKVTDEKRIRGVYA